MRYIREVRMGYVSLFPRVFAALVMLVLVLFLVFALYYLGEWWTNEPKESSEEPR